MFHSGRLCGSGKQELVCSLQARSQLTKSAGPGSSFFIWWTQRNCTEVDFNTLGYTSNRSHNHTEVFFKDFFGPTNDVGLRACFTTISLCCMESTESKCWPLQALTSNKLDLVESSGSLAIACQATVGLQIHIRVFVSWFLQRCT